MLNHLFVFLMVLALMLAAGSAQNDETTTSVEEVMRVTLLHEPPAHVFVSEGRALSLPFGLQLTSDTLWQGEMVLTSVTKNGRRRRLSACHESGPQPRLLVCQSRHRRQGRDERREFEISDRGAVGSVDLKVAEKVSRQDTGTVYELTVDGHCVARTELIVIGNYDVDVTEQNRVIIHWYFRMLSLLFLVMFVAAAIAYYAMKRADKQARMEQLMRGRVACDAEEKSPPSYSELFSVARSKHGTRAV